MREILFRGKHVIDGRWIEGFYNGVRPDLATMQTKECHRILSLKSLAYDVVPDTVGQFTGLTDKNGKKIFEGDIIDPEGVCWARGRKYIVSMDTERAGWFPFARGDGCGCCEDETYNPNYCEVIGNIHDNPELMEDK